MRRWSWSNTRIGAGLQARPDRDATRWGDRGEIMKEREKERRERKRGIERERNREREEEEGEV